MIIWKSRRRDPVRATGVGIHTYDGQLPSFAPDVLEAGYQKGLQMRCYLHNESTLATLAEYEEFVGRLAERCRGQFAVGKDYYNFLLRCHLAGPCTRMYVAGMREELCSAQGEKG